MKEPWRAPVLEVCRKYSSPLGLSPASGQMLALYTFFPLVQLSGSLALASLVQVLLGGTGLLGLLMRYIGPLTVVPTILLIGLSMFSPIVAMCQHQWGVAFL